LWLIITSLLYVLESYMGVGGFVWCNSLKRFEKKLRGGKGGGWNFPNNIDFSEFSVLSWLFNGFKHFRNFFSEKTGFNWKTVLSRHQFWYWPVQPPQNFASCMIRILRLSHNCLSRLKVASYILYYNVYLNKLTKSI